jgi:hypothetical protein
MLISCSLLAQKKKLPAGYVWLADHQLLVGEREVSVADWRDYLDANGNDPALLPAFNRIISTCVYLYGKDFSFYRNYLNINLEKIVILLFIFGDLVVAFKNLDVKSAGVYIAMSLFTKFVFIGYIFIGQTYKKVLVGANDTEENILEIFYSQINTMLSFFAAAFVFVFILSRYIVEIFFGSGFAPYQSSLPFIMLANMSLAVALSIYITALRLGDRLTKKISKFYSIIFFVLFVFMTVNYVDTVTYFIIGSSTLLSIFLYNFVIKKPAYIENTYNHLF